MSTNLEDNRMWEIEISKGARAEQIKVKSWKSRGRQERSRNSVMQVVEIQMSRIGNGRRLLFQFSVLSSLKALGRRGLRCCARVEAEKMQVSLCIEITRFLTKKKDAAFVV